MNSNDKFLNYGFRESVLANYCKENSISRITCPSCGYPTLKKGRGLFEFCFLCDWEDDGQNDNNADKVIGGPNKISLTQSRNNFDELLLSIANEGKTIISDPAKILEVIESFEQENADKKWRSTKEYKLWRDEIKRKLVSLFE